MPQSGSVNTQPRALPRRRRRVSNNGWFFTGMSSGMINGCRPYYTRVQPAVNVTGGGRLLGRSSSFRHEWPRSGTGLHLQAGRLCQNRVFVYTLL